MRMLTTLALLSLVAVAQAEPPPGTYDRLRAEADDAVTIQVTGVRTTEKDGKKEVAIFAKVLGVERSKSGLKKGDEVTIPYTVLTVPIPGPSPVPVLEMNNVYPAFLNKKEKTFVPAAAGLSFKMTPEAVPVDKGDRKPEKLGEALTLVDELLKVGPADATAKARQAAVVAVGQSGEVTHYLWVQARLKYECKSLEGTKAEMRKNLTPERVKEIDAKIEFLTKTCYLIDAPR